MPPADFRPVAVAFAELVTEHQLPMPTIRPGPRGDEIDVFGGRIEVLVGVPQPIDKTPEARARSLFARYLGRVEPERILELLDRVQKLEKSPRGALFCQWCGRHRRTGKPANL